MNLLSYEEALKLQRDSIEEHGGTHGVLNQGLIESALAQPEMSFGGQLLYESIVEKAAAMGFSFCKNHGFRDGNKRIAFLAMFVFLFKNGYHLQAPQDEATRFMLDLAAGQVEREDLVVWLEDHLEPVE